MLDFSNDPHRRYNILTGEWVLVSPRRTKRPWQGKTEKTANEKPPSYDPGCYLCPGNTRAGDYENPNYTHTLDYLAQELAEEERLICQNSDFVALVPFWAVWPYEVLIIPRRHFHMAFYPPLLRSATVKKFMVGYEMFANPQRDITAEMAAANLRQALV